MLDGLSNLGITFDREPEGAFYAWGNVSELPEGINNGMSFFRAAITKKIIVVPGEFFDVNPGKRRDHSRFKTYVRFSFGPKIEVLEEAMIRLDELILEYKNGGVAQ